jgi:hypothetical protein
MLGLLLIACTPPEVTPFPSSLDFGEVDFQETMPDDGYHAMELEITNTGDKDVSLEVIAFDFEHLCLQGYTTVPATLSSLSQNSKFTLLISVCDYIVEAGERDNLLSGNIEIDYGADTSLQIPWSFTPVLNIAGDTGN